MPIAQTAFSVRNLERHELETIWQVDRSEEHDHVYRVVDGELVKTPFHFRLQGWRPGHVEHENPLLPEWFDHGAIFRAMFDGDQIIGFAIVEPALFGPEGNWIQLKKLYVSQAYRKSGIGKRLFAEAQEIARQHSAKFLYVSATPTENTVHFYQARGCFLNPSPDPELFADEPKDIHFLCKL